MNLAIKRVWFIEGFLVVINIRFGKRFCGFKIWPHFFMYLIYCIFVVGVNSQHFDFVVVVVRFIPIMSRNNVS